MWYNFFVRQIGLNGNQWIMFWGEYTHQLDKKSRLIIPARFRARLSDDAILTRGMDHNLVIYPETIWSQVTSQLNQMSITHPTTRALRRLIFSGAIELGLDRQGRITLPDYLRDYASLSAEKTVLLVGMENYIEIWEPSKWQSTLDGASHILADSNHIISIG